MVILGVLWWHKTRSGDGGQAAKFAVHDTASLAATTEEVMQALEWLASSQEDDGSWAPEKWAGHPSYKTGISGLALLAFLGSGQHPENSRFAANIARGLSYLLTQQAADGRFGPAFSGASYNHGIATLALIEAYAVTGDERFRGAIGKAVDFITSSQGKEGAWGYFRSGGPPNTSITVWQLQALLLADSLGWPEAGPSADAGLAWLAGTVDAEGRAGYRRQGDFPYGIRNLSAMAAFCLLMAEGGQGGSVAGAAERLAQALAERPDDVDYCHSYFLSHALQAASVLKSPGRRSGGVSAELDRFLLQHQLKAGPFSGSWEPTDQWGSAGGRIYSTAMAALSLEAAHRTRRLMAWTGGGTEQ